MNGISLVSIVGDTPSRFPFGFDEEDDKCLAIKLKLAELVVRLKSQGHNGFLSDCQYGVPLWGAEVVTAQRLLYPELKLYVYIPSPHQSVKWTPEWRERYYDVHAGADELLDPLLQALPKDPILTLSDAFISVTRRNSSVLDRLHKTNKPVHSIFVE